MENNRKFNILLTAQVATVLGYTINPWQNPSSLYKFYDLLDSGWPHKLMALNSDCDTWKSTTMGRPHHQFHSIQFRPTSLSDSSVVGFIDQPSESGSIMAQPLVQNYEILQGSRELWAMFPSVGVESGLAQCQLVISEIFIDIDYSGRALGKKRQRQ